MLAKVGRVAFALFLLASGFGGGYVLWGCSKEASSAHVVRIAEAFPDRQFVALVQLGGNEEATTERFIVDTGADTVVVTPEVAERWHLEIIKESMGAGIGGVVRTHKVRIPEMRVGSIVVRDIEADVIAQPFNLLGMTFLEQLSRVEIKGSILTLEQ